MNLQDHNKTRDEKLQVRLERQTALLTSVLNSMSDLVFLKESNGVYLGGNTELERLLGRRLEEIVGKIDYDFFPRDIADSFRNNDKIVMAQNKPRSNEEWFTYPDGHSVLFDTLKAPLRDEDGKVIGLLGVSRDITERKRIENALRESEERFRTLAAVAPVGIFQTDPRGNCTYLNRRWLEIAGVELEQVLGKGWEKAVHPDDREWVVQEWYGAIARGEQSDIECRLMTPDGRVIWVSQRLVPLRNDTGGVVAYIGIIADITALKQADAALRKTYRELEERTQALEDANRHLRNMQAQMVQSEKLASLGRLVAGVSHEINNPLSVISNNLVVMSRDAFAVIEVYKRYEQLARENDPVRRAQMLGEIRRTFDIADIDYIAGNLDRIFKRTLESAERIRRIVRNMRDFARLGEAQWKEAQINEALETTLTVLTHEIRHKHINVVKDYGDMPEIYCMPGSLNQAFFNIIINAIEAVPENGTIIVTTWTTERTVKIAISNNGPAIPREHLDKLFDPFFTTKPRAVGLGLAITYGIIAEHEGRIQVETDPAAGTTFTIELPLRKYKG